MMEIAYIDETAKDYAAAVTPCATAAALRAAIEPFRYVAEDACRIAARMTDADIPRFVKGLERERRGKFSGEDWMRDYGAILMPALMFHVSMVAIQFGAPWGAAFHRLKDIGAIIERDGVAIWKGK